MRVEENPYIDTDNTIENVLNGCKVRLFFITDQNEKVERLVLSRLMMKFDRKIRELSNV